MDIWRSESHPWPDDICLRPATFWLATPVWGFFKNNSLRVSMQHSSSDKLKKKRSFTDFIKQIKVGQITWWGRYTRTDQEISLEPIRWFPSDVAGLAPAPPPHLWTTPLPSDHSPTCNWHFVDALAWLMHLGIHFTRAGGRSAVFVLKD